MSITDSVGITFGDGDAAEDTAEGGPRRNDLSLCALLLQILHASDLNIAMWLLSLHRGRCVNHVDRETGPLCVTWYSWFACNARTVNFALTFSVKDLFLAKFYKLRFLL